MKVFSLRQGFIPIPVIAVIAALVVAASATIFGQIAQEGRPLQIISLRAEPSCADSKPIIGLFWNQIEGETQYNIFRAATGGGFEFVGTSPIFAYTDSTPQPGTSYTYQIHGQNSGLDSNQVQATALTTCGGTGQPQPSPQPRPSPQPTQPQPSPSPSPQPQPSPTPAPSPTPPAQGQANRPPSTVTIAGPTTGTVSQTLTYSLRATDPDGDRITYRTCWDANGDGNVDQTAECRQTAQVASGNEVTVNASWPTAGSFLLLALAHDGRDYGQWSWQTVVISSATGGIAPTPTPQPQPSPIPQPTPTPLPQPTPTPSVGGPVVNPGNFALISPANGATNVSANPAFDWQDSQRATYYWIYLGERSKAWYWVKKTTASNASWDQGNGWEKCPSCQPQDKPKDLSYYSGQWSWWVAAENATGATWADINQGPFAFTVSPTATPSPSPSANLPNLTIKSFTLDKTQVQAGEQIEAQVEIANIGILLADKFRLTISGNDPDLARCPYGGYVRSDLPGLAAGQSQTVTLKFTVSANIDLPNPRTARAFVDSDCQVTESNEDDNQATTTYTVSGYSLERYPNPNGFVVIDFETDPNAFYAIYVLLKNNGQVVTDQSDFKYLWTIEDPSIAQISPFTGCTNGIQPPCPEDHLRIDTLKSGDTNILVSVTQILQNQKVVEARFHLLVKEQLGKPDLAIDLVTVMPATPQPDEKVDIVATIINKGTAPAQNFYTAMVVEGVPDVCTKSTTLPPFYYLLDQLAPGQTSKFTLPLATPDKPFITTRVQVYTDVTCVVDELDETNNSEWVTFKTGERGPTVSAPGPTSSPGTGGPGPNRPPNKPVRTADFQTFGNVGQVLTLYLSFSDPDGDSMSVYVDWGNNQFSSAHGVPDDFIPALTHSWSEPGQYKVRAKAIDTKLAESDWSDPIVFTISGTATACTTVRNNGDPAEKLDVTFVPIQYSQNELDLFVQDVNLSVNKLLFYQPFSQKSHLFNFHRVDFPFFAPENLFSLDVRRVATTCPYDKIIMIVNRPTANWAASEGIGSTMAYVNRLELNLSAGSLVAHEFGHIFGALADEYISGGPEPPAHALNCSKSADSPPWREYPGTNLGIAGCTVQHYYRPTENSLMRSNLSFNNDPSGFGPWNIKLLNDKLKVYE